VSIVQVSNTARSNGRWRDGDGRRGGHRIASQRDGFSAYVVVSVGEATSRDDIDIASQQFRERILEMLQIEQ